MSQPTIESKCSIEEKVSQINGKLRTLCRTVLAPASILDNFDTSSVDACSTDLEQPFIV